MFSQFLRTAPLLALLLVLSLLAGCALPGLAPSKRPTSAQPKTTTVALVVPATQAARAVSALTSGANLAVTELAKTNRPVTVRVVRMEGNWLATLASLPENSIIGGPLSEAAYRQMKAAGLMNKKVVFAFLPRLDAGDEGQVAWRFFPSLEDQVDAVVNLAGRLDVNTMASFGPTDRFATAATNLMEQKLAAKNIILQRIVASGDPSSWGALVRPYVNPTTDGETGLLTPQTPFEAVFLTDSWRRLTQVNTAFASNGEVRLFMLGTMLWDGFHNRGTQNASQYAMVAYPSAFLRDRAPQAIASSSFATFWGALGYDFVRFANRLNVSGRPDAARVSSAARQAALMTFAMAPISYTASGMASQKLYMVQPGIAGPQSVNVATMRAARAAAVEQVRQRGQQAMPAQAPDLPDFSQQPAPGTGASPSVSQSASPAVSQPATPAVSQQPASGSGQPIMRSRPNTSYKLSLPGAN